MAPRKSKTLTTAKSRPQETAAEQSPPRQQAQTTGGGNPNRLLREAAWSRMFGRVESKNPFAR